MEEDSPTFVFHLYVTPNFPLPHHTDEPSVAICYPGS